MRLELEDSELGDINLAPLIDCLVFMLMFFMATMNMSQRTNEPSALPLKLPHARAKLDRKFPVDLTIEIDAHGAYRIDRREVRVSELRSRLKRLALAQPEAGVRIDADRAAAYEDVAHVVDVCEFVGLRNVALGMRSPALRSPGAGSSP
jgi:biopolymer transport protein ExbD